MSNQLAATAQDSESSSFFSSFVSFLMPTAHAEEQSKDEESEDKEEGESEEQEESSGGDDEAEAEEEEEEEEEPEDPAPAIRQACQETECQGPAKHFKHCSDKVEGGKGWHGEDCVEELFHLMHCLDACSADKLFKKLA